MRKDTRDVAEETRSALNETLREVIQDLPDVATQLKCRRRERFGRAQILLAPFCLAVALLPWTGKIFTDQILWFGFSVLLLVAGAWQIDKASREEEKISKMLGRSRSGEDPIPRRRLWRVK